MYAAVAARGGQPAREHLQPPLARMRLETGY